MSRISFQTAGDEPYQLYLCPGYILEELGQARLHRSNPAFRGNNLTMPRITNELERQLAATRMTTARTNNNGGSSDPSTNPNEPIQLVYNIRTDSFRTAYRSSLIAEDLRDAPMIEIAANMPPLLVDGRMLVIEIPKWKLKVDFLWRTNNGVRTKLKKRVVRLPGWVWVERNFRGKWGELWIERGV